MKLYTFNINNYIILYYNIKEVFYESEVIFKYNYYYICRMWGE